MTKRKSALVSQYLEGVSGAALEEYQEFFREFTRKRHGVYALYRGTKLYYVGLAKDLRGRVKTHLRDRHGRQWDRFSLYLTIGDDHIRELESLVLRIVKPKGNRLTGKLPRAQNLRKEFARRVRADARKRLEVLLGRETTRRKKAINKSKKTGRVPVLAKYPNRPRKLRGRTGKKVVRATVRKDGSISFGREVFNSPSLAARAAIGDKRAMNGWYFWTYERAPGDWVRLQELRR